MSKLRKGIVIPIIPEDFIGRDPGPGRSEPKRVVRNSVFTSQERPPGQSPGLVKPERWVPKRKRHPNIAS
jgi:hypothetical protein